MLFTNNENEDYINILTAIEAFTKKHSLGKLEIDSGKLFSVVKDVYIDFPYKDGIEEASVFKKSADFLCYFISKSPIESTFPKESVSESLRKISNHQNIIIGLFIVATGLKGATIEHENGGTKIIENPIELSRHSYFDIVEALSHGSSPGSYFYLISVLIEQLVYKNNPDLQYEVKSLA